jgi:hypothetical protein
MAEAKNYVFDHTELTELLIKKLDVHSGLWGVYIEFGFGAANVNTSPTGKSLAPAAISFVQKIGIQQLPEASNLTVDAAIVNPLKPTKPIPKSTKGRK